MWVRGLKLDSLEAHMKEAEVAPYVGAWIETGVQYKKTDHLLVAPYVGAWIETSLSVENVLPV